MTSPIKNDCAHFRGDKPCRARRLCADCPEYDPLGARTKVLILKCRAQGDVLRTTALLPGLKRKYPRSHITWVVDGESVDLLADNPLVDAVLPFGLETLPLLEVREFDVLVCLDKEPGITALATRVRAARKFGFGMNAHGNLTAFNDAAAYALRLGIDDDLKYRKNRKTYQEIVAEAAEVDYARDEYIFELGDEARGKARAFMAAHGVDASRPAIGLNTGAGSKFETKQWPEAYYRELVRGLTGELDANVFLLGGPREEALNTAIAAGAPPRIYNTGNDHALRDFAGFISLMDVVVTSDTLGMHLAIALKKKVVALFGPTCPQEIDLYDRGVKIFTGASCAPCYKQTCPDAVCMKGLLSGRVLKEVGLLLA
jgi:ADP-heptose:LPS heptosyltransferase